MNNTSSKKTSAKGFATVYILLILGTVMFAIMIIIEAASGFAAKSITEDACFVTGRSLLAEYNKALFRRYGIFALRAHEEYLENRVGEYMDTDLSVRQCVVKLRLESADIDTAPYTALDTNALLKQTARLGIVCMAQNFSSPQQQNVSVSGHPTVLSKSLPSGLLGYRSRELVLLSGGLFEISPTVIAADEYILSFCSNQISRHPDTYLTNETEYILFGYSTDAANLSSMRRSIYAVRYAKNTADVELPPDPVLAAAVLAEIAFRTEEEVDTIVNGGEVDGMNYTAFLRAFLSLLAKAEKTARLMDIMQLNLQYIDGSSFSFADYAYGFDLTAKFAKKVVTAQYAGSERRYRTVVQTHSYK